ncbi:MAG: spore germination protein [Clostridia bacterium]|nr:spore germination protein [Clostridia bacterium]
MKTLSQTIFDMNALNQLVKESTPDMRIRHLSGVKQITVLSLDGMSDDTYVSTQVVQPIVEMGLNCKTTHQLSQKVIFAIKCDSVTLVDKMRELFYNGYTLVFISPDECLALDTRTTLGRNIVQPPTSNVTKGPREGFVESIKVNITLLRKRIKGPELHIEYVTVGKHTNTMVAICYISSIASQEIADKIVQRIKAITVDGVLDSSYISSYLDHRGITLFRMVGTTEKPDVVAGKMLEGRIAVIVDGSPIVLTIPYLFVEDIQGPEDYYGSPEIITVNRILRSLSAVICVILPSLYVSLQLFNYQIIPLKFLITIFDATQNIPFNPLVEMVVVLVIFDILREANARMPSIAGLSLSLIGAVVLGDAAVRAGLLGAPAVMIGALSGIGLYTMPNNTLLLTLVRLVLTFIGGIMGLFGLSLAVVAILAYMVSLSSFGAPYLAPFAPDISSDRKDALIKVPLSKMYKRPQSIKQKNDTRIK